MLFSLASCTEFTSDGPMRTDANREDTSRNGSLDIFANRSSKPCTSETERICLMYPFGPRPTLPIARFSSPRRPDERAPSLKCFQAAYHTPIADLPIACRDDDVVMTGFDVPVLNHLDQVTR